MPTIMITGANRGIGLELLRQYAAMGWQVLATCRDPSRATAALAIANASDKVALHALDVTDAAAVNALADELRGTAIDVLVLNAGVMGTASTKLGALEPDDFLSVLRVNVVAPAICAQAFRSHVSASGRKVIVGVGSILGSIASNSDGGLYGYRSSKAGLNAIIRSLSIDLCTDGVIAIAMHPGWVQTDMGGANATITTAESVAGMARVIEGLQPEDNGGFFTFAGETLPW